MLTWTHGPIMLEVVTSDTDVPSSAFKFTTFTGSYQICNLVVMLLQPCCQVNVCSMVCTVRPFTDAALLHIMQPAVIKVHSVAIHEYHPLTAASK